MTDTIYHVTSEIAWNHARALGRYRHPSLDAEGFVHCATSAQLTGVWSRYFSGWTEAVVLCIDVSRVRAEIRWEGPIETGGPFPHVYGPLNLEAVSGVQKVKPDAQGELIWPARALG